MSHELFDATKAIKQGDDISDMPVLLRTVFTGKKLPTFNGDPLSHTVEVHDPSMLEGQKGALFARTKSQTAFSILASWFNSFANDNVPDLVNKYYAIVKRVGEIYMKDVKIFFRPAGVILSETEWILYHMSTEKCSATLPAGYWTPNYVMCCGCYGEKMIQGAPNSFVLYTRKEAPLKVTVPSITAPFGVAHDFFSDDTGVTCHERGNKDTIFFHLTWEALHRKKWDPTNRPIFSINGRATTHYVKGLSNPELSLLIYDDGRVRFDCDDALDFWLEIVLN